MNNSHVVIGMWILLSVLAVSATSFIDLFLLPL